MHCFSVVVEKFIWHHLLTAFFEVLYLLRLRAVCEGGLHHHSWQLSLLVPMGFMPIKYPIQSHTLTHCGTLIYWFYRIEQLEDCRAEFSI